jgi:hypothetical protein
MIFAEKTLKPCLQDIRARGTLGMVTVNVNPGVCKFEAVIDVRKIPGGEVEVNVTSQCKNVNSLCQSLSKMKVSEAVTSPNRNVVIKHALLTLPHSACPIPCAVIKAVEAEAGLALKKDVSITFVSS